MIEAIEFTNYKALRKTTLPLAPFTLLLGPNGSGKSSVLQAIQGIETIVSQNRGVLRHDGTVSTQGSHWLAAANAAAADCSVIIGLRIREENLVGPITFQWGVKNDLLVDAKFQGPNNRPAQKADMERLVGRLARMQTFALDPVAIANPVQVNSAPLRYNGTGLVSVLDDLKDNFPERWELLLAEFRKWLPEYDHIQFTKPQAGQKAIALRTRNGNHQIPASELSQGTLVALALLTLAYLPNPPSVIGLEEIDRGLHPRLLRHLQDALYRLTNPESCGEKRPPIQVIATTHSPYLLDLYRDHPEEVVLAQKEGLEVQFRRLSDMEHFKEILGDAPLSEVWYSGVLGGVSVKP